jgi:hypothetical protein
MRRQKAVPLSRHACAKPDHAAVRAATLARICRESDATLADG